MNKQELFCLSYFIDLNAQDWRNFNASGVRRVLLGYSLARDLSLLTHFASLGCRAVIRLGEELAEASSVTVLNLQRMKQSIQIDTVILGCEPDNGIDFRFGGRDAWDKGAAASAERVTRLRGAVGLAGLPTVAPAMTWPPEMISEDGTLLPGRRTWADNVRVSYQACDGVASHCGYVMGWDGNPVNPERFKNGLKRTCEEWHKPIWIDEGTFPTDDDMLQMRCATDLADIIMQHPAKERVWLFAPFASTGDPQGGNAWPPKYLLKDEAAYRQLGRWMAT